MPEFAALSVLVLAWDEAAPTLRTLLEAAPAVGSLLVLLPPAGPAEAEVPLVPDTPPVPPAPPTTLPAKLLAMGAAGPVAAIASPLLPAEQPTKAAGPLATSASVASPAPDTPPVPAVPPAVRLLRLASNPPSLPRRAGTYRVPAAPYVGATPVVAPLPPPHPAPLPASSSTPLATAPVTTNLTDTTSPNEVTATAATATDTATDQSAVAATSAATEVIPAPSIFESQPVKAEPELPLTDLAFRADEILDPDPEQELQAAPSKTPAATPADSPALLDLPLASNHGPFGQRLPPTEPATYVPAPRPARLDNDNEPLPPNELPPRPAPRYPAPDLNTQIIRYARQAVPTALAEGPFEVLYAPAWPTWLAAVELRQRSGRPLVLHLPALAAGRQPADTAAGWPAEIQRQALRQADLVLVETYALARRLRRELGLASGSVRVVTPGDAGAIARALRRVHRS